MKISCKVQGFYQGCSFFGRPVGRPLWRRTYTMVDPTHVTKQGQSTIFKKGDTIIIHFEDNVNDPAYPVYSAIEAATTFDNYKDWDIKIFHGGDLGDGYGVLYVALHDNAVLNNFNIYFLWSRSGNPGTSQPWYFTNADSGAQHDETGQTILA